MGAVWIFSGTVQCCVVLYTVSCDSLFPTVPPLCTIKFHVVESECHFYVLQQDKLLHVEVVIVDIYKPSQLATQHLFYKKLLENNLNFND